MGTREGSPALLLILSGIALWLYRRLNSAPSISQDQPRPPEISAPTPNPGNMRTVDHHLVNNPQVAAFLRVIRQAEGTSGNTGYSMLYGGGLFDGFSDHPNTLVTAGNYSSTAAGAYQFKYSTWKETAAIMGLPDFSPVSQDIGALGRIAYRGALVDVLNGNLTAAVAKTNQEWASLPGSPYGQPTVSMQTVLNTFQQYGGKIA